MRQASGISPSLAERLALTRTGHEDLRLIARRLTEMCASSSRVAIDPAPLVAEFELALWIHFTAEEGEDHFGAIARERPSLATRVATLKGEHAAMFRAVSELGVMAADKRRERDLAACVAKLLAELRIHERKEDELMQEFILRDDGVSQD
jgi:hypothetical protein